MKQGKEQQVLLAQEKMSRVSCVVFLKKMVYRFVPVNQTFTCKSRKNFAMNLRKLTARHKSDRLKGLKGTCQMYYLVYFGLENIYNKFMVKG